MMAGKPWTDEQKAAARAKREAAKKTAPARPRTAPRGKDPVVSAVETVGGVLVVPLTALGQVNESFLADALAVEMSVSPLAEAVGEVAKVNPAVGEFFQRGAPLTPYMLLASVLFGLGTQIAVNHGMSVGPLAGSTVPRSAMVIEMKQRLAAAQQQAQQQEAAWAAEAADFEESARIVREAEAEELAALAQQEAGFTGEPVI